MTRKLLFLLLICVAAPANADPYDKEYNQAREAAYEAARAQFLDQVRTLWFAHNCHAINDIEMSALFSAAQQPLAAAQINDLPGGYDPQLRSMWKEAQNEGRGMAWDTAHHVCDYWHNNPNAVYELRQEAAAAMQ